MSKRTIEISFSSNDTFREIFQSSAEGIIMVNKEGSILIANPVAERMFGYEPGELTQLQLENLLPDRFQSNHSGHRDGFHQHPSPRRMGVGRDLMAKKKNGKEFPVEISLSHKVIDGQFLVTAFIIDITGRKKSEEALRRSEEQLIEYAAELEKKVQARTEALNKTIQELEKEVIERKKAEEEVRVLLEKERELNELKTKFVSIASHEFRTPLSTVLSSASLINQYKQKGDLDKMDKHILRIKSSVNHLTSILNDFLSLGKLEEGRVEVQREPIQLDVFFHEIFEDLVPAFKEGQNLEFEWTGTDRIITSDPRILRNIFFNLISNASKYSGPEKPIVVSTEFRKGQVCFSIKDHGQGIPQVEIKHIFERFFRASNAGNIQGTGLGLNIVKRYIDLLDGTISFHSEEGIGTTFTVTIPLL